MGEARFTGPKTVAVTLNDGAARDLTAEPIFINTGCAARGAHSAGAGAGVPSSNSTSIMELDAVPEHLLVLGGGYVGLEFGQMFRRFGSQVTIVQRGAQLLAREDADVADEVAEILREDGIEVLLESDAVRGPTSWRSAIDADRRRRRTASALSRARTCWWRRAASRTPTR